MNMSVQALHVTQGRHNTIGAWIEREWIPQHPEFNWSLIYSGDAVANLAVLAKLEADTRFEGYQYGGRADHPCPEVPRFVTHNVPSGAYRYTFVHDETGDQFDALVINVILNERGYDSFTVACVPQSHIAVWHMFAGECYRIQGRMHAGQRVFVIGGRIEDFKPRITLEDVILDEALKADVFNDVRRFYSKGIDVYKRLHLKPFRKLLLAGVPGTGKTMLCTALAKWMLDQGNLVIYVSSSDCNGATFSKIDQALNIAANAACPTMILLEEIDAYLHKEQKAMVLNVLDGNESRLNAHGTLLIATTNYPEAIDERVLKRPGRLDRIFIVPPLTNSDQAERMLKLYLGDLWLDAHRALAPRLIGFTGAFVREVVIYALTQFADTELEVLPVSMLVESFEALQAQIDARDDLIKQNTGEVTDDNGADYNDEYGYQSYDPATLEQA
jgi:hypothetical protein